MRLKDQVAIVTGGGRGIGRAIALRLARDGAKIGILDLIEENAKKVADEVKQLGSVGIAKKVDASNYAETKKAIDELASEFNTIDILVNNVGIDESKFFIDTDEAFWDRFISVNYMMKQNKGKIVSIGSDAGRVGNIAEPIYCGAKGAIIATTKALARELARYNINVNCVCPGPIETDLLAGLAASERGKRIMEATAKAIPLKRIGQPEDVADVVAFFVSDDARYLTGQVLSVDGGLTMIG
jgi:2-hydroxycyclohexanecarboxyl-CoA dehydrogenase